MSSEIREFDSRPAVAAYKAVMRGLENLPDSDSKEEFVGYCVGIATLLMQLMSRLRDDKASLTAVAFLADKFQELSFENHTDEKPMSFVEYARQVAKITLHDLSKEPVQ